MPRHVFRFLPPFARAEGRTHDELLVLAEAVIGGDRTALRTFVTTIVPDLVRMVRRVLGPEHPDIEDTAYEAAYAVIEALPRFRGEGTVRHFAHRVAVLTAMNVRRREAARKRARRREEVDPDELQALALTPEQQTARASIAAAVRELLTTLPEPLAEAMTLHLMLGYTISEIATATGCPTETVRSRLRLAKRALRKNVLGDPDLAELLGVEP